MKNCKSLLSGCLLLGTVFLNTTYAIAQNDTLNTLPNNYSISLLTCGVGDEIYTTYGHTAIRVSDSVSGEDKVYNYGTFDGYDPDFAWKFMKGKLNYYLSTESFEGFVRSYASGGRRVYEQVLQMTPDEEKSMVDFLQNNAQEANKYYQYDFLFDNCATRVRDVFPSVYGKGFQFGQHTDAGKLTFRDVIDNYMYAQHWTRLGQNILLGTLVDKKASNLELMFVPDYLMYGLEHATVNGKKITQTKEIVPGNAPIAPGINQPVLVLWVVFLITIAVMTIRPLSFLRKPVSFLLLFVTGLLGCLMLFMWVGTDHQTCKNNFNILWALPFNLILAFMPKRNRKGYAIFAMLCMAVLMLLQLLHVQAFSLLELSPLLLSLLLIYFRMGTQQRTKIYGTENNSVR